jgi:hypothetical protein
MSATRTEMVTVVALVPIDHDGVIYPEGNCSTSRRTSPRR